MHNEIYVHLVVIGKNPVNNEFSVGLVKEDGKYRTISGPSIQEPDVQACTFSTKHINAPPDWYEVRKRTFILSEQGVHLIYAATIPNNIKLKNDVVWCSIQSLSNSELLSEVEKDIILEGIKL